MLHNVLCSHQGSGGDPDCACGTNRRCRSCGFTTGLTHECDPESMGTKVTVKQMREAGVTEKYPTAKS